MKKFIFNSLLILIAGLMMACSANNKGMSSMQQSGNIPEKIVAKTIRELKDSLGDSFTFRIERGVKQVAELWRESDGSQNDFVQFCKSSFVADENQLELLYSTLERNFEVINGYFHKMNVELKMPLQLVGPDITPVDMMFGSYSASSHLTEDLYSNKIAFLASLNFPFYSDRKSVV